MRSLKMCILRGLLSRVASALLNDSARWAVILAHIYGEHYRKCILLIHARGERLPAKLNREEASSIAVTPSTLEIAL